MGFNPEMCSNESEVESKLIVQYLLPALGYTPDTWYQEVVFGNIRLDFLAFAAQVIPFQLDDRSPLCLVLEAKHPKQKLDNHVRRFRRYLNGLRVRYGLLTNGKDIRIYRAFDRKLELVFQCDGQDIEEKIGEVRKLIGREYMRKGQEVEPPRIEQGPNINSQEEKPAMKTIAIYHHKGGVGKTTVSVNLAATLRKRGHRVLLVDMDAQANSTFATGLIKFVYEEDDNLSEKNAYHILESSSFNFIPEIVRQSDYFNQPEIDVVPSHISLIEKQGNLLRFRAATTRLAIKLERVRDEYDFVIIDTPPSLDIYAQTALMAADYLIVPSDLKPFSNQGLRSVRSFIEDINEARVDRKTQPIEVLGVLPSKIPTYAKYIEHTFPKHKKAVIEKHGYPVFDSIIFERSALANCVNKTIQVGDLEIPDPKSILDFAEDVQTANKSAEEFEQLTSEILHKIGATV